MFGDPIVEQVRGVHVLVAGIPGTDWKWRHDPMTQKPLTWKFLVLMMLSGLPVCGLILLIIYDNTGRIGRAAIAAVTVGYVASCVLLVIFARAARSKQGGTVSLHRDVT